MRNIIFGPIISRRFGTSLGVDVSPETKRCNFDCLYCELAPKQTMEVSDTPLEVDEIIEALQEALHHHENIDVITLTANGEPTMYPKFTELTQALVQVKENKELLILTNSASIHNPKIQKSLHLFDQVKCSLDAVTKEVFEKIDRPHKSISIESIVTGLQDFAKTYKGKLIIEVLIVQGINDTKKEIEAISEVVKTLGVHRLDVGTIDRPPAYGVQAVDNDTLENLSTVFDRCINVHVAKRKVVEQTQSFYSVEEILQTLDKRPLTKNDVDKLFDATSKSFLQTLVNQGKVILQEQSDENFYILSTNLQKKRQKA